MKNREQSCPDCGVLPGQLHEVGCDVERCYVCGGQFILCTGSECARCKIPCVADYSSPERMRWSGEWPGNAECREFGFWCVWDAERSTWQECAAGTSGAIEDLNRLHSDCVWNRAQKRWVLKDKK